MVLINIYHCLRSFSADTIVFYKLHLENIYDNKKHQKGTLMIYLINYLMNIVLIIGSRAKGCDDQFMIANTFQDREYG